MNRWFLYGPFALAAAVLIVWFFLWRAGADLMRKTLDEFAAAQAGQGVVVSYDKFSTRGFPFFLRGVVDNLSIAGDDRYTIERLYIDVLPYQPDRLIFSPGGAQRAVWNGAEWTIETADARFSVERDKERGWTLKSESGPFSARSAKRSIAGERLLFDMAPDAAVDGAFDASLRVLDFKFEEGDGAYALDRIDAAFSIGNSAGGRRPVDVHGFQAVLRETEINAEGALKVGGGEPAAGRFDAEIRNAEGLAPLIARSPHLRPEEARIAAAALVMLSPDGVFRAPVEVSDKEIRIAGVKIADYGQP